MNKYLGVDWGDKKIGLAISDELGITTKPFMTIKSDEHELIRIIEDENISVVVFGMPRSMDGGLGPQAGKVESFVDKIRPKIKAEIVFEDETNTTRLVKSQMIKEGLHPEKNRDLIDQKSAQLILEGYLHEKNN
jgi:putative Holliday junction resolvase